MSHELLSQGVFIERVVLKQKRVTAAQELVGLTRDEMIVQGVYNDITHQDNLIYKREIEDSHLGSQQIVIGKTLKPYNPSFRYSAQIMSFIFPADMTKRVITPLDGDESTWRSYFNVNKVSAETMGHMYGQLREDNQTILIGTNFSPYADKEYLKTQSVKAVHTHIFLITDELLKNSKKFSTIKEFRQTLRQYETPLQDINKDTRRFFGGHIYNNFIDPINSFVLNRLEDQPLTFAKSLGVRSGKKGEFPLSAIEVKSEGVGFLDSSNFYKFLYSSYNAVDEFYKEILMPIFAKNYNEVIKSKNPDASELVYNSPDVAQKMLVRRFSHPLFWGINGDCQQRIARVVTRISQRLDNKKGDGFALGPAFSVGILFNPKTYDSSVILNVNPFGSGSVEMIGLDKISKGTDQERILSDEYYHPASKINEQLLYSRVVKRLSCEDKNLT